MRPRVLCNPTRQTLLMESGRPFVEQIIRLPGLTFVGCIRELPLFYIISHIASESILITDHIRILIIVSHFKYILYTYVVHVLCQILSQNITVVLYIFLLSCAN